MNYTYYRHTNDPHATLAYPHYSCPVFSTATGGKLIYGVDTGSQGEYADRLWQWDHEKAEAASEQCDAESLKPRTAARTERWLSLYFDRPVTLRGIIGGVRPYDGYDWYFYRFDFTGEATS